MPAFFVIASILAQPIDVLSIPQNLYPRCLHETHDARIGSESIEGAYEERLHARSHPEHHIGIVKRLGLRGSKLMEMW